MADYFRGKLLIGGKLDKHNFDELKDDIKAIHDDLDTIFKNDIDELPPVTVPSGV